MGDYVKERLDLLLVERRLVESRTKAKWLIDNGYVLVNDRVIRKPSTRVDNSLKISLKKSFPYVGRRGLKLEAALNQFCIGLQNKICADIGASIGGFTDCLLKHGAEKVYAIDIAVDLLHPSLICNKKQVIALLGVDARKLNDLGEKVDMIVINITFSLLKDVLRNVTKFLKINGDIIVLVKPIFENDFYGKQKFKVVKDKKQLRDVLNDLLDWSVKSDLCPKNVMRSPILGKGGSTEFFIRFKRKDGVNEKDYARLLKNVI
ncbi:MAG: TlyA family rRNA (cytidine-2'-O)-methyltransferase [Promethearchaeota archaeon]|nr:MAG: TlyA family rRNA (cytidine-2'-O)-methyltransferase [Candidatus Lokiarchaeota archaeon]